MTRNSFSYDEAFSRNIGWVTLAEQARLQHARVAIAGLGGVGGAYLLALARLGVGAFSIADFDHFDIVNFNRQVGATVSSIGRPKLDVMVEMVRDINPQADVRVFPGGLQLDNIGPFLADADVYLDGLDFFAFAARQAVFAACADRRIPAVTVAPLGMGAALLSFLPGKMTFEQYFGWADLPDNEKALRFLVGLSPWAVHAGYLVDRSRVDLGARRGPSTMIACQLCAGIAAAEVLKIIVQRGDVLCAPRSQQFDAYRNKLVTAWRPGGHRNPLQRLAMIIARRQFGRLNEAAAR